MIHSHKTTALTGKLATLAAFVLLQACSGGSGGGGSDRAAPTSTSTSSSAFVYSGPPPASQEIQDFKIAFYDNLVTQDRCGACHTNGGQDQRPLSITMTSTLPGSRLTP